MGQRLQIVKGKHHGPNGGISARYDEVFLVGVADVDDEHHGEPNAVYLEQHRPDCWRMVPVNGRHPDSVGWMASGAYVAADHTVPFYGAVALHDRQETAEEYARYSA